MRFDYCSWAALHGLSTTASIVRASVIGDDERNKHQRDTASRIEFTSATHPFQNEAKTFRAREEANGPDDCTNLKFNEHDESGSSNVSQRSENQYKDKTTDSRQGACGIPPMTEELWTGGEGGKVVQWMRNQMDGFQKERKGAGSFFEYVVSINFPNVTPSHKDCNLVQDCPFLSCDNYKEKDEDMSQTQYEHDRRMAVYAVDSFRNFHQFFKYFLQSFQNAASSVDRMSGDLVGVFNWADDLLRKDEERIEKTKKRLSFALLLILVVTTVVSAIAPYVADAIAGGVASSGISSAALTSRALGREEIVKLPGYEAQKTLAGAVIDGASRAFGGAYSGGSSLGQVKMGPDPEFFDWQEIEFGRLWSEVVRGCKDFLTNTTLDLMAGRDLTSATENYTIIEIISKSKFYLDFDDEFARDVEKHLEKQMVAYSMNLIWQDGQYPYILAVNVAPGACEQDTRAHLKVKVCLPEYPDKSFWMYAMNDGSNPEGDTLVQPLPGQFRWENNTSRYNDITRKDVVRSSMRWYELTKNKPLPEDATALRELWDPSEIFDLVNNNQPTGFQLSICENPRGEAISSINMDNLREYPCMCGTFPTWNTGGNPSANDTSKDFLLKSGLIAHPDFREFCEGHAECESVGHDAWELGAGSQTVRGKQIDRGWYMQGPFTKCPSAQGHLPSREKENEDEDYPGPTTRPEWQD